MSDMWTKTFNPKHLPAGHRKTDYLDPIIPPQDTASKATDAVKVGHLTPTIPKRHSSQSPNNRVPRSDNEDYLDPPIPDELAARLGINPDIGKGKSR